MTNSGPVWLCLAAVLATSRFLAPGADAPSGFSAKKLGEAATIEGVTIKGDPMPGGKVSAVVKIKLDPGYHVHSDKPSEPQFIGTVLTVEPASGVRVGTIVYPPAKSQKVEGLEKPLSVFEGEFQISVPLGLTAAAKLPVSLPATLRYQACRGAQCYAPRQLKFEIKLESKPAS